MNGFPKKIKFAQVMSLTILWVHNTHIQIPIEEF
jgi:hypothetical protein